MIRDPKWSCTYCGKEVPDSIHHSQFVCCGEVGHVDASDSIQEDIDAALQRYEWGDATPADMQLLRFFNIEPKGGPNDQVQV